MRVSIPSITAIAFLVSPISSAEAQEGDWRTIEFETGEVTDPDVAVSPDGEWLVIGEREDFLWRVLALDPVDSSSVVLRDVGFEYWLPRPQISPNGRSLYYSGGARHLVPLVAGRDLDARAGDAAAAPRSGSTGMPR